MFARERPIVFTSSRAAANEHDVFIAKPDGESVQRVANLHPVFDPVWSPNGQTIAFRRQIELGGVRAVNLLELMLADASQRVVVTEEDEVTLAFDRSRPSGGIAWSPDGESLAYASTRDTGDLRIWLLSRWGGQERLLVPDLTERHHGPSFSPHDPSRFAYVVESDGVQDIWLVDPAYPEERQNLTRGRVSVRGGVRWSPSGDRLAFCALDPAPPEQGGGDREIYVLELETDEHELTQVTNNDASDEEPSWAPDGASLLISSDRLPRANGAPPSEWLRDLWLVPLDAPERAVNITPPSKGGGNDDAEADWWHGPDLEP